MKLYKMEKLKNLLELSSLPGVPTLIKVKHKTISLIWLIFIIFLSVLTIILILIEIKSYFDYKIITNIDVIREDESQFPTVSFCFRYINNNTTNSNDKFELKNILTNCQFNLNQCNWTDFEVYSLTFNNVTEKCFRFNSGYDYFNKNNKSIRTINTNDLSSGLNLAFSLDYFLIQSFNDLHIIPFKLFLFIQNNSQVFRRDHAYKIESGLQIASGITFISLVKKLIQKLPKPYNECIKQNTKEYVSDLFQYFKQINKTYLQTDCLDRCIGIKMEYNCKSSLDKMECYTNLFYKYRFKKIKFPQECYAECPLECDINDFKIEQTYMGKMKDHRSLNISIYYKTLDYLYIKQIKKSNPVDLVSNIGSNLGLFIGLNFFNFIELFQIIVSLIIDR
jgi:hypothetical protein